MITYRKIAITIITLQFFVGIPILTYLNPFIQKLSLGAFEYDMVIIACALLISTIFLCRYINYFLRILVDESKITVGMYHTIIEEVNTCVKLSSVVGACVALVFFIVPDKDIAFLNSIMLWLVTISTLFFIDSVRGVIGVAVYHHSIKNS